MENLRGVKIVNQDSLMVENSHLYIKAKDENYCELTILDENGKKRKVGATWSSIIDKPTLFPPATHTHDISSITDLQTSLDNINNDINNLEGIHYVWSPTNRTLTLYDDNENQLSQVSLTSLYNDDTLAGDIIKRVDKTTGENVNYRETTTWYDGSGMDDSKVDGVVFKKINNKYYQKIITEPVNILDLGAKNVVGFDNTKIIQEAFDYYNEVFIPEGEFEFVRLRINKPTKVFGLGIGKSVLKTIVQNNNDHLQSIFRVLSSDSELKYFTITFKDIPDYKLGVIGQNPINTDATLAIGWSEAWAPSNSYMVENVTIEKCEVKGSIVHGIAIGVSRRVKIIGNKVSEIRGSGIWGYYADEILVQGNDVSKTGDDGIYISANGETQYSPHSRNKNVIIENNKVFNASAKGIGISGCENAEIRNNIIDTTFADGIMASGDMLGGHVSPRNVNIYNNTLINIFGAFGTGFKHQQSVVTIVGGQYSMIVILSNEKLGTEFNIYNNVCKNVMSSKGGYYGIQIDANNVNIFNNSLDNGSFGIAVGNVYEQDLTKAASNISIKSNVFKNFYRNINVINASKLKVLQNIFGKADNYCFVEENIRETIIAYNIYTDEPTFYLNQTGSIVNKVGNIFEVLN